MNGAQAAFVVLLEFVGLVLSGLALRALFRRFGKRGFPGQGLGLGDILLFAGLWLICGAGSDLLLISILKMSPVDGAWSRPELPAWIRFASGAYEYECRQATALILQPAVWGGIMLALAGFMLCFARIANPSGVQSLGAGKDDPLTCLRQAALAYLALLLAFPFLNDGWPRLLYSFGFDTEPQPIVRKVAEQISAGDWSLVVLFAGLAIIVAPIIEELLFRALLFRALAERLGVTLGVFFSASLFALIHNHAASTLPLFLLGVVLALLYARTGSVLPAIVLHSLFNGSQLLFLAILQAL